MTNNYINNFMLIYFNCNAILFIITIYIKNCNNKYILIVELKGMYQCKLIKCYFKNFLKTKFKIKLTLHLRKNKL